MPEQLKHNEPSTHSDKDAQSYIDGYLKDIGSPDISEIRPYDRQIMHDLPLLLSLEPLDVKPNPDEDPGLKERNIFLRKPKGWLPKTKQEAKWANDFKLRYSLERAAKSKDPAVSFKSRQKSAEAIWADAMADTEAYNRVVVAKGTELVPDVAALRQERAALYAMADRLMAREFLDKGLWPIQAEYKKRRNHWRGFMLVAAQSASDSALADAFNVFSKEADVRREFWRVRVNTLSKIVGRLPVSDTVGNQKLSEGEQIEAPADAEAHAPKPKKGIDSVEELYPEEIQGWLAERRHARAELIERLDQQGMPQAEKLERVNREFPELEPLESQWHKEYARHARQIAKQPPVLRKDTVANKPGIRRLPGYDNEDDPSNPWHY